jgi:hypothetical protein
LPHSTTLARWNPRDSFREVMECGSPMPVLQAFMGEVHLVTTELQNKRKWSLLTSAATLEKKSSRSKARSSKPRRAL